MKKSGLLTILGLALVVFIAVLIFTIGQRIISGETLPPPPDPAFGKYITAFSAGVIPTDNSVEIKLAFEMVDSASINKVLDKNLFRFRPRIEGQAFWKDKRTIEYRPDEKLPHDQTYTVDFYLSKLLNVKDEFKTFRFGFVTMRQSADVSISNIETYYTNQQPLFRIKGEIKTADAAVSEDVIKILNLSSLPAHGRVEWQHSNRMRNHIFTINDIQRNSSPLSFSVPWNANPVKSKDKGSIEVEMPAPGDFKLVNFVLSQTPDAVISLQFSEPLNSNQNLTGLVHVEGMSNIRTRISNNEIKVFLPSQPSGNNVLFVERALQDINGNRLADRVVETFRFENIKPAVRLVGRGVVMPASTGLLFPFEAVNLAAVDVSIVKIFENNIGQFLQGNQLDGSEQMRRVGRIVAKKTLSLMSSGTTNLNAWNKYSIDLSEIVLSEPGALYQVIIDFKKEYSVYPCDEEDDVSESYKSILTYIDEDWEKLSDEVNYYGSYDSYYYYYHYNWRDRDNPCTESYYYNKSVSRNVLASDIGIIAKRDADGTYNVFISDITTTRPMSGVTVELYNFQQQIIEAVITDKNGKATIKPRNTAFLLVAKKDEQRGYLRVDDGNSLSLSMFDVSGQRVQEGIKGFVYGERGVWRPGDTLFLTLILEDLDKRLPQGHPVVFELYNPLGQLVYSTVSKEGLNGFYHFKIPTSEDDITGNWNSVYKIGGREFSQRLRIETIMPNRLRINLDFGAEKLMASDMKPISLFSEWLHGAAASNLRAEVNVTLNQAKTTFKGFEDYVFDDPAKPFYSETHTVFSGRLDAQGRTNFLPNIRITSNAPGMLRASFETKVFEQGGAFSVDRVSIPYLPFKSFAGIKTPDGARYSGILYTDSVHNIGLVCVDGNGKLVRNAKMKVDVYKVGWRWWWESSDEYFGDFSSSSYNRPIQTQTLDAVDGKANYSFKVDHPEWGRYLILVTDLGSGHRTGKTVLIDWPSWYGARDDRRQEAANMLSFNTDKEKYKTGEDIKFSFPSSEGGRALVSFENGTGVFKTFWVESKSGTTTFSVKATPDMSPNFYAHISLLQKHAQTENDLPIRLYGVAPILVEDPHTILKPVIKMPDALSPGEMVNIHISEENGKAMTYTLAMVDEGLLDLTRFTTPEPWKYFYAREAIGVRTWDMYDFVLGAFGGEFARMLSIGGDAEIDVPVPGERATRFRPVVKYLGPFELQRGRSQQHSFKMPQYVGSVRVMAVAGQNGAYGSSEKTVPVKQSLMILGTLPRVLGPGETVKLPVNVFVTDPAIKNVSVSVSVNEMLNIKGDKTKSVSFNKTGEELVFFDLETPEKTGVATVRIKAKSGSHEAEFDIELNVRNPNPEITEVVSFIVEPGQSREAEYKVFGIEGTNMAVLEVSSIPPLNLEKRLKFLTRYPHGCTEQIISGAFPQLFLRNLIELDESELDKIQENVQSVINRVVARQISNGGISMWPGSSNASDWISSYAGHFIVEALEKGYSVPEGFLSNWRGFQQQVANRWIPSTTFMGSDLMQAYRLYTLALSGATELGAMNRMREIPNLSTAARWRLAAAYFLAGQAEAANKLVEGVETGVAPYNQTGYTYGSNQRDQAMIIETLTMLNRKGDAAPLVKKLSEDLANPFSFSTQTTSFALLAIAKFHGEKAPDATLNFTWKEGSKSELHVNTSSLIWQGEISVAEIGKTEKISVANKSTGTIFGRAIITGIPSAGMEAASQNDLTMRVSYKDTNGNAVNIANLKQGTSFIAEVTIENPGIKGDYSQLALTQIFPSGWEISNVRMDESAAAIQSDLPNYQDIRDDRVYTYFNLRANESKTFRVMLIATYEGEYYLPAFHVEAMYDSSIYANSAGRWVKVIK